MATKYRHVKAIIQLRRATEEDWIRVNPILRLGEPALSTDVYKLKIGNGTSKWSEIDYLSEEESGVSFVETIAGHTGKEDHIYVDKNSKKIYIWENESFVEIEGDELNNLAERITEAEEQIVVLDRKIETTRVKLYDETGYNVDGGMTQRSVTVAIEDSADPISTIDLINILV